MSHANAIREGYRFYSCGERHAHRLSEQKPKEHHDDMEPPVKPGPA